MMGWGGISEQGWRKGPWTPEEDKLLTQYVSSHGEGRWTSVSRCSGLNRKGKSCRLRWVNYLRPGLKRGHITPQEEGIIIELHALWGNKWSTIARYLPGRTDNEIKNYWRTHFKKKRKTAGITAGGGKGEEKIKFSRRRNRKLDVEDRDEEDGNVNASVSSHSSEVISAGDQVPDMIMSVPPAPEQEQRLSTTCDDVENQCFFPPTNKNNSEIVLPWPADSNSIINPVDGLWGWLWNINDDMINWREGGGGGG